MLGTWSALLAVWLLGAGSSEPAVARDVTRETSEDAARTSRAASLRFAAAAAIIERAIRDGTVPGCAVLVGTRERVLWRRGFGALDRERPETPTSSTLYDLASVTKVASTSLVLMTLVERGLVRLDDPLTRYIPEFTRVTADATHRRWRRQVTIEQLLTHTAGLVDWAPLYNVAQDYDGIVRQAVRTPLERRPGGRARYSDLDFILLGELAQRVTGRPLAELEREFVFAPVGMRDTLRGPLAGEALARAAATSSAPEGGYWRGVVEDRNARTAGGVTGHAGLFSSTDDMGRLARALLRSLAGEAGPFPAARLREFTTRRAATPGSSFALGWDTPTRGRSTGGDHISATAFGHTGWTGTSLWIDPARDLYVVLLANRVHPRHTDRVRKDMYKLRRAVHDAIFTAVDRG